MRVSLLTSDTCNISLRMNRVRTGRPRVCGLILDWNSSGLKFDLVRLPFQSRTLVFVHCRSIENMEKIRFNFLF